MNNIKIIEADFSNEKHSKAILKVLNSYAKDPMGMNMPLDDGVKNILINELSQFPLALSLIAFDGEQPAGIANCFYGFSTFSAKKILNIHDLAVSPSYRRMGIGKMLIRAVEKKALEMDCCKITLEVREDNRARKLYEREGFEYGEPTMYFMTKELEQDMK
jgi:ribosomal protein S18 acetylase RimI-like enzyme